MKLLLPPLLLLPTTSGQDRYTPLSTANILYEQSLSLPFSSSSLSITSDVPVTLQRYSDTSTSFLIGAEPVPSSMGMLLITSDCSSEETNVVPNVEIDGDDITVTVGGDGMGYLGETTYETVWSYVYGMCGFLSYTSTEVNIATMPEGDGITPATVVPFSTQAATEVTTAATITSTSTTEETTTTISASNNPCGPGKCLNFANQCTREAICLTHPCERINCPKEECVANFCGGCEAICLGEVTGGPSENPTVSPSKGPTASPSEEMFVSTKPTNSSDELTVSPNEEPTDGPSDLPTLAPVELPVEEPVPEPTPEPVSPSPINPPSNEPTISPNDEPTVSPSEIPTPAPIPEMVPVESPEEPTPKPSSASVEPPSPKPVAAQPLPLPFSTPKPVTVVHVDVPRPVPAVDESVPQPTQANTPDQVQDSDPSTTYTPSPTRSDEPDNPVVVIVNVPVQTVPDGAFQSSESGNARPDVLDIFINDGAELNTTVFENISNVTIDNATNVFNDSNGSTALESGTQSTAVNIETDVEDILDTPAPILDPTTSPIESTPSPTPADTAKIEGVTSSPAPSYSNNRFIDALNEASSGFALRYTFHFRLFLTLIVLLAVTIMIPGQEANNHLFGYGKVFVAAIALSSAFTWKEKGGNVRRKTSVLRDLQDTCTYNVEILYDGCSRSVQVDALSARVIDVVLENFTLETNEEDECQVDYSANLTFPASNATELDVSNGITVGAYDYSDWQCLRAIEGRPFYDVSGKGIQAMPIMVERFTGEINLEWSGDGIRSMNSTQDASSNVTSYNLLKLGNEWTQRALGEHASIASFSAFSIALMTNGAPSWLVEDSLKAGLDEIRHARVSFEIASKLLGKEVEPGSLPESKHEFGRDLTGLALAVAREGCVDETLSALGAAVEVDNIEKLMKDGGNYSKYSGVAPDLIRWIGNELKIIALDESNHSSLAWRTLKWVCNVDFDACEVFKREVFDASKLELRFQQRSEGDEVLAKLMKSEWEKIYDAFLTTSHCDGSMCKSIDEYNFELVAIVSERVLQAISY